MNGIRKSKKVGSVMHSYLTQNGQVVRETIGTGSTAKILDFVYDNNGQPFALCYSTDNGQNFTDYYYITNMQGDVVRLVNSAGGTVANYSYDAWGKLLTVTDGTGAAVSGTNTNHIANRNPIRYRGYYYDTDTGWYYLQSRYYDPTVGRFINADLPEYAAEFSLDDNNLFAYCGSNPILRDDKDGEFWEIVVGGAIAGAIIGAASSIVNSLITGEQITFGSVAKAAGIGALQGAICGLAGGLCGCPAVMGIASDTMRTIAQVGIKVLASSANAAISFLDTRASGADDFTVGTCTTAAFVGTYIGASMPGFSRSFSGQGNSSPGLNLANNTIVSGMVGVYTEGAATTARTCWYSHSSKKGSRSSPRRISRRKSYYRRRSPYRSLRRYR